MAAACGTICALVPALLRSLLPWFALQPLARSYGSALGPAIVGPEVTPEVAAKNKWERIAALQQNTEFQIAYRDAYVQWRNGDHDVVFPYGTYKMRVFHGAKCRGPDHPLPTC